VADGHELDLHGARLEVLHTPGHTPGSVSVVAHVGDLRVLLAGDTLWGGFSGCSVSSKALRNHEWVGQE
jgi:glyoxylase-like metal-dependent hydrolase (beta-lactamase superfamily II)